MGPGIIRLKCHVSIRSVMRCPKCVTISTKLIKVIQFEYIAERENSRRKISLVPFISHRSSIFRLKNNLHQETENYNIDSNCD